MTNGTPSQAFQKYAKAIGVDINSNDIVLLNIAYSGFNKELELKYSYEIFKGEVVYKNTITNVAYEIHPNYKIYRRIVNNYKDKQLAKISEALNTETFKNDKINIVEHDTQSQIDEIEKNFKNLELEYQTEVELLEHHVKKACGKFLNDDNLLKLSELTHKFEEIDKCKRECKTLYKVCQAELEKLCDQIMKLERLDNENYLYKDTDNLYQSKQFIINSDSEDEDDINLKVKCFNEKELDEFLEENLESYLSLKSIRK